MRRRCAALLVPLLVLLGGGQAAAETILFANLTTSQETFPVVPTTSTGTPRPESFGVAFFTLNDAMTALTFTATVFNIDFTGTQTVDPFDNLTAAHIHASPTVTPTTNAGVVWGFFGIPFNDINPMDTVIMPFPIGVGGMVTTKWDAPEGNGTTLTAQLANILSGHSYINFHTTQFGAGEIRGAINVVSTPVPEPATMLLVGVPMAVLLRRRWRDRRGATGA